MRWKHFTCVWRAYRKRSFMGSKSNFIDCANSLWASFANTKIKSYRQNEFRFYVAQTKNVYSLISNYTNGVREAIRAGNSEKRMGWRGWGWVYRKKDATRPTTRCCSFRWFYLEIWGGWGQPFKINGGRGVREIGT